MSARLLTERTTFSGTVDRSDPARPVVRNVLLCGPVSVNKRRYLKKAFEGDRVKRYNGVPVKVTVRHGDDSGLYQEEIGVVENARHREDGMPLGDIPVNPHKPYAEAFLWDAEHQPKACGISHVAKCETVRAKDGWDDVTEMVEPASVDVIGAGRAATTKGLFESTKGATVFTWKQLVEWVVRHPRSTTAHIGRVKRVAEMDAMGDAPALPDAPAGDAEPDDTITAALQQAGHDAWDMCVKGDMTFQEFTSKAKDILKDHGKYSGDDGKTGDADAGADKTEARLVRAADVLAECKTAGFSPSYEQGEALRGVADPAARKLVLESFRAAEAARRGEAPVSAGRDRTHLLAAAEKRLKESNDGAAAPSLVDGPLGWNLGGT